MKIKFIDTTIGDVELLIKIYNAAFYHDYIRYGQCPGYGKSYETMKNSIIKFPKKIIYCDDVPVGVISMINKGAGKYNIGCLCVIPEYQHKGIGSRAVTYALDYYKDWKTVTLITPADKEENVNFYVNKCGFHIKNTEMDGNVKVYRFLMER